MTKPSAYCSGYKAALGKALGLGDRPYRSLVIREPCDGLVTATVEFLVTTEQAGKLLEAIEKRRFYLAEAGDPIEVSVAQHELPPPAA